MKSRVRRLLWSVGVASALAAAAVSPPAAASSGDGQQITKAEAKALFQDALALVAAGDYPGALDKLQRVASYKRTPAVVYYLGLCHEKTGEWVMALGEYRIALADARQQGRQDVVEEASKAVKRLAPKIPHLRISLAPDTPRNLRVMVDGNVIRVSSGGRDLPIDPGDRVIEATSPGYEKFEKRLKVEPGAKLDLTISLAKKTGAAGGSSEPTTTEQKDEQQSESSTKDGKEEQAEEVSSGSSSTLGWVVTGAGVIGLGVAGVFYGKRSDAIDQLDKACGADRNHCPASSKATYDDGKRDTLIANIALGAGIAGVLTGVVLLATSGGDEGPRDKGTVELAEKVRLRPSLPGTWAGLSLDARF